MTVIGGRRRKQLLDDLKEKRRYGELKEEALDRTLWRTRFGRGYGPVVRQTAELMNLILGGYLVRSGPSICHSSSIAGSEGSHSSSFSVLLLSLS
jgi:hypothetical protein